ncbi:MAG: hypothetical protein ACLFTV_11415, partial [Desulfococcaceae bacterium]
EAGQAPPAGRKEKPQADGDGGLVFLEVALRGDLRKENPQADGDGGVGPRNRAVSSDGRASQVVKEDEAGRTHVDLACFFGFNKLKQLKLRSICHACLG